MKWWAVLVVTTVSCQELITLDSACGVVLQSSCPDLQKYVVGESPVSTHPEMHFLLFFPSWQPPPLLSIFMFQFVQKFS